MNKEKHEMSIYLVVDPSKGLDFCLPKIEQAIDGGVNYIQIWNKWSPKQDKLGFAEEIANVAVKKDIPVYINERWELLKEVHLSGVHFDKIPYHIEKIKAAIDRPFTIGLTCGNDLSAVEWAIKNKLDYISFCSIFPSPSAGACEIIPLETIARARELSDIPIFLSGGITLNNIDPLLQTGMNGIAVISGIMDAEDPAYAAKKFKERFQKNN